MVSVTMPDMEDEVILKTQYSNLDINHDIVDNES